ncbi:carbohydrate ABC transporter permease [Youxingia wuxianensis]|nr:sugar ABC transporter permease [Youxingia wuxianensis]
MKKQGNVNPSAKRNNYKQLPYYAIFMGPTIILYLLLFIIPFIGEVFYSFTDWNGISSSFNMVGLKNYIKTFGDEKYWYSMWFTIKFSFFTVIFSNLIAFVWSYILSHDIPFRNFWRALIFLPRIIGGVILGFLWRFIFQEVFVQFGKATGLSWFAQDWFSTESSSFWALVIVFTWTLSGYLMLIYSAGFASIPDTLIEAATIDGAKKGQILKDVIIPMLMPSITRCLFIGINWAMLLYDTNISLTSGNPFRLSEGATMNIYATAFRTNQMAYGAAKSTIFVLVVVAITILQVILTSRKEVEQ